MRGFSVVIAKAAFSFHPQTIGIAMVAGVMVFLFQLGQVLFYFFHFLYRKGVGIEFRTPVFEKTLPFSFYAMVNFRFDLAILHKNRAIV